MNKVVSLVSMKTLAAGQVNVTAYDIAMAQLEKAGRKVEPNL